MHDQQEKLTSGELRLQALQRECFEKVEGATELAEKQNALTMTLEAKVMYTFYFIEMYKFCKHIIALYFWIYIIFAIFISIKFIII